MGTQASKPVASADSVSSINEKPPSYTTGVTPRTVSSSTAVTARQSHGHGRDMDESLVIDDLHSWSKSFDSVRPVHRQLSRASCTRYTAHKGVLSSSAVSRCL
jgi:hypothetical protein